MISYGVHGGNFANEEAVRALGLIMKGTVVDTKVLLQYDGGDFMAAIVEGKIGEKSLEAWEGKKEDVVKGFEELVVALKDGGLKEAIAA